jgi:hypothetical protein
LGLVELMLWYGALHLDNAPSLMFQNLLDDGNQGLCGYHHWRAMMGVEVMVFLQHNSDFSETKETDWLKLVQQWLCGFQLLNLARTHLHFQDWHLYDPQRKERKMEFQLNLVEHFFHQWS